MNDFKQKESGAVVAELQPAEEPLLDEATLSPVNAHNRDNTVIVLEGPPRSGKSVLRQAIKDGIRDLSPDDNPNEFYPYVITACPDGEGAWFQETVKNDPELAAELKANYKSKFTPEFVDRIAESVERCDLPLVFVDVGGITSEENKQICATATHAIIISSDPTKIAEWESFNRTLGITTIGILESDYYGKTDNVQPEKEDGILRGSVHYLERGEACHQRPMVQAVVKHVMELANRRLEEAKAVQRAGSLSDSFEDID